MKRNNISVSHNPESNLYLSSGIAPVNDYLNENIPVSLGTDGAASNDGINMFSAMREMWNVYKIKLMNIEVSKNISEWDILKAATINGAKALKIDSKTGSIDVGKEADISLISRDELGISPVRNNTLPALLIYSGNSRNIKYVVSDGKVVVDNGKLIKFNESILANNLTKVANDADHAFTSGKLWTENIDLTPKNLNTYIYRYRSVRKKDSVNIKVINHFNHPIKLTVASSGAVFGGGTPAVISPESAKRFPMDRSASSFSDQFLLESGATIIVRKTRDMISTARIFSYEIVNANGITIKRTVANGQLLLLAENKYKPFNLN